MKLNTRPMSSRLRKLPTRLINSLDLWSIPWSVPDCTHLSKEVG